MINDFIHPDATVYKGLQYVGYDHCDWMIKYKRKWHDNLTEDELKYKEIHDKEQYCTTKSCQYCRNYKKRVISLKLSDGGWWIVGEFEDINKATEYIDKNFSSIDTYRIDRRIFNIENRYYKNYYYIENGFITVM